MKQIHLHEEARKYVQEHIVPETDCEGHEIIDLMKQVITAYENPTKSKEIG